MKLSTIAADAAVAMFRHESGPPVFVVGGAAIMWTVQGTVGSSVRQRALGLGVPPGRRLWILPDGCMGIAMSLEELTAAYELLEAARLRSEP